MRQAHEQQFVGRTSYLETFEAALASAASWHLWWVHGPGGVGKSSLLRTFQYRCADRGVPVQYLDARHIEPTVPALQAALPLPDAPADATPRVLLIDTFEVLQPVYRWLRTTWLPQLPDAWRVVCAGRAGPPADWRTDLGLHALLRVDALRNLSRASSEHYLEQRAVPEPVRTRIRDFAHGHPLALALAADAYTQQPTADFAPVDAPDVVGTLVQRFLERVPSDAHRKALEACALVRGLTEPLLTALTTLDDPRALFDWLRGLSFMDAGANGLFPHDVVRTAVIADLRWRAPDAFADLHRRARTQYLERLNDATQSSDDAPGPRNAQHVLMDYLFLFRHNPVVQPIFQRLRREWNAQPPPVRDAVQPDDWPILRRMVAAHEGEASAAVFDHWRAHQPDDVQVFRAADGTPVGFVFPLHLEATTPDARAEDPVATAAWEHLQAEAPLRADERATLFRFWMSADAYQDISPVQSLIAAYRVRYYLSTPRLAYTMVPCAAPEQWALLFAYADLHRMEGADATVGDVTYGLFGHDWRAVPPAAWLELLADRNITPSMPTPGAEAQPTVLVLSREDFDAAVKAALKTFARPADLHDNPLLRSRLVARHETLDAPVAERAEILLDDIHAAADALRSDPKTAKYYRAVDATYLDPQPTQERAAEFLDLPFSTYRRHLRRGIAHIADRLWRVEVAQAPTSEHA
ncbi:ATP-binding protein [Salisaeta longa]|uniref:ATP-binding protein n=1 Tax=Salisaeta longa TaxID=503170 RepID=UPI0012F76F05|nr:ATP-binding protein [Salisaeta longa]